MIVLSLCLVFGLFVVLVLHAIGLRERAMTPIVLFLAIEIFATWPALVREALDRGTADGLPLAALTVGGTLAAVFAYVLVGGARASVSRWRDDRSTPDPRQLAAFGSGVWLLVSVLGAISFWRLGGLPPMLTGGLSALIDPLTHSEQVATLRETRRVLTKGYLVGESYQGQGLLNAFTEAGWQVAVVAAVLRHGWERSSASLRQLSAVAALGFVFLSGLGQRSPLLLAFVAGVAAVALLRRLPSRRLAVYGLVGVAFLLFIAPLSKGQLGGTSLLERQVAMASRITEGNGQHNVAIVRLVESGILDVRDGSLFVDRTLVMIPGAPTGEPFALTLTRLTYGAGANTTGFSTPTNFGYLFADGKDAGVLLGYAVLGGVIGLLWRFLVTLRSPYGAILCAQGAVLLGYTSVTGLQGLLASAAMSCVAVLVIVSPEQWSRFMATRREPRNRTTARHTAVRARAANLRRGQ